MGQGWASVHGRTPLTARAEPRPSTPGPSLRQVFIIFDSQSRLQGTQPAVNFHLPMPGPTRPGKGKSALRFPEQRWGWPRRSPLLSVFRSHGTQTLAWHGLQPLQDTLHCCDHTAVFSWQQRCQTQAHVHMHTHRQPAARAAPRGGRARLSA